MYDNDLTDNLLSLGFSQYEIENHIAWLKKNNYINVDENTGRHYHIGIQGWAKKLQLSGKNISTVKVEAANWATKESWMSFISGVRTEIIHKSLVKKNNAAARKEYLAMPGSIRRQEKIRRKSEAAENTDGLNRCFAETMRTPTQVSLTCIQTHFPISKSTASRWRARAAKGGYITNEQQLVPVMVTHPNETIAQLSMAWQDYLACRSELARDIVADNPEKLVLRAGLVFIQQPNLVAPTGKAKYRTVKRWIA